MKRTIIVLKREGVKSSGPGGKSLTTNRMLKGVNMAVFYSIFSIAPSFGLAYNPSFKKQSLMASYGI
jgi:hypothetical protein